MKKIFLSFILFAIFSFSYSQKIDENKVSFEYVQYPLEPISKDITNYTTKVVQAYEPSVKAQKDAYKQQVKDANDKYNADMVDYNKKVAEADAKYNADMAAYNQKTLKEKVVEKDLLNEKKPQKQMPSLPSKTVPAEGHYQKLFTPEVLASGIKLEGFKNLPTNAVTITITMAGFEMLEPEPKSNISTRTENGVSSQVTQYYYLISYRHTMGVKVEVPGKGVVLDEMPAKLAEYKTAQTPGFYSDAELSYYWNNVNTQNTFVTSLEEKAVKDNFDYIAGYLNDKYGYLKVKREIEVNVVKEHEGLNYDDYQQAYEAAIAGLNQLTTSKDQAALNLTKASEIWEAAMKESKPHE